jgi:benzoate membrane transport protein
VVIAVSPPLVVLALGLGNVQGLGFLQAQGYRVPATPASVVVGLTSIVSALFGGHPANVSRFGVAVLAGPEAGPYARRYWATLIASALMMLLALGARPVAALLASVPASYVVALAGLAILAAFEDALGQAFAGSLRFGAMIAFVVAASSFTWAGLPAACWALVAGLAASLLLEHGELLAFWRGQTPAP